MSFERNILSMVYKLGQSAQKKWCRLRGKLLAEVIRGVKFKDGESIMLDVIVDAYCPEE
jgi:hypothetical protein